jgi:hypothetical protein
MISDNLSGLLAERLRNLKADLRLKGFSDKDAQELLVAMSKGLLVEVVRDGRK